jgi:hypothetical protein
MAQSRKSRPAWQRPGSPIGRKGPRKAHPRYTYTRNKDKDWTARDVRELKTLVGGNTPTRVIGLKLGRTETSIRGKARREGLSLRPANRSPYNRSKNTSR